MVDYFVRQEKKANMENLPKKAWMPGPWELVILLVIVLVIFGPGKLAGVGKSLGSAIADFKDSVSGKSEDEDQETQTAKKSDAAGEGKEEV